MQRHRCAAEYLRALSRLTRHAAIEQVVEGQKNNRANEGYDEVCRLPLLVMTHEPADEEAGDSDDHRNRDSARVLSRLDQLRESIRPVPS